MAEARARYETDLARWAALVQEARDKRERLYGRYQAGLRSAEQAYNRKLGIWREEQQRYNHARDQRNEALRARRRAYEAGEPAAVVDYSAMVLARSDYPDSYPRDAELEYHAEARTLVVDFTLPPIDCVPDVIEVTFDRAAMDYVVHRMSDVERAQLHRSLLQQVTLRTIHELFEADTANALDTIVLNGWLRSSPVAGPLDCVLSVRAAKAAFAALRLDRDPPERCLQSLESVGAELPSVTKPVEPIVPGSRRRDAPTAPAPPAASVYGGDDLAHMAPLEFERLVRLVLERDVQAHDEKVLVARMEHERQIRAMVVDAKTRRIVRLVAHAHACSEALPESTVAELQAAMESERASLGLLMSTGPVGDNVRELAASAGIRVIDCASSLPRPESASSTARRYWGSCRGTAALRTSTPARQIRCTARRPSSASSRRRQFGGDRAACRSRRVVGRGDLPRRLVAHDLGNELRMQRVPRTVRNHVAVHV